MLKYMLDTDTCIYIINRHPPHIKRLFNGHSGKMCISAVTLGELLCGAEKSKAVERNLEIVEGMAARLDVLPFGDHEAKQFAQVKAELELSGHPIGPYDMMIAGHARSAGLILITNNTSEFNRVEGLRLENWVEKS